MSFIQKLKEHWILVGLVCATVGGGAWWYRGAHASTGPIQYGTGTVSKQTIVTSVSGSGQVSAKSQIDLKPQGSGTIVSVNVKAGQQVKAGTLIASLDQRSATVSIQQAQASLTNAQINYTNAVSGLDSSDPDVISAQTSLTSAQNTLDNAKNNFALVQKQQDLAVANAKRSLLNNSLAAVQVPAPYSSVNITDSDTPTILGGYTGSEEGTYFIVQQGAYYTVSGLESATSIKMDTHIPSALGTKGLLIQFPNAQISATWKVELPNKSATNYLSSYNTYQSALQSQQSALASAQNQVTSAELSLSQAQTTLQQKVSPGSSAAIAQAKASLESARASLLNAQNSYMNNRVVAPFDGVIAKVNSVVGDQASASTAVATLITQQKIVTLTLNEVDVSKVQVGQSATLTFSAVSGLTLTGKVSQVDMIGTVSQGVVNYSVQIALDADDSRVLPGMSASASIIIGTHVDVLAVPNAAVKTSGGSKIVQVITQSQILSTNATTGYVTLSGTPTAQEVVVGSSNDTYTEITSGLHEGDMVITQTIDPSKTKTTTNSSNSSLRIPGITGGATGGVRTGGNAVFISR